MPFFILLLRLVGVSVGVMMIGLGVPLFFLPIPLGLIFIAAGLLLLVASSTEAARWIRGLRRQMPKLDGALCKLEALLPGIVRRILAHTRPS